MNYYVHVPFCHTKCGYCVFYSEAGRALEKFDAYAAHLERQLAEKAVEKAETIYIGGGTPTLPDSGRLEKFLRMLEMRIPRVDGAEISIEANPETLDENKIALLREHVTRISVGVQSFDFKLRCRIGRNCSQEKLETALKLIVAAKFPHWNCDLIYALPGQSETEWELELRRAAESGIDHLSCYSLTPEEESSLGFTFHSDDEMERKLYDLAEKVLSEYGIARYEISNYGKPGCECRHNCNVWRGGKLMGFGPSAAGFDGVDRWIEPASLAAWLAGEAPERDHIDYAARLNEIFAVNLRTSNGWSRETWQNVSQADGWNARLELAHRGAERFPGCWQIGEDEVKLSREGLCFWNDIAETLL